LTFYQAPDGSAGGTGGHSGPFASNSAGGAAPSTGGQAGAHVIAPGGAPPDWTSGPRAGATASGGATVITIATAGSTGGIPVGGGISLAGSPSSAGGISSNGGTGGGGTSASSIPPGDACANLTCLDPMLKLLASCQVGATDPCTQQLTMSTSIVVNDCYSNGVKMRASADMSMSSMTMTVKSGSSVCYTLVVGGLTGSATTIVVKDPSEATVGTIDQDSSGSVETVTCPGGTPTVVAATCGSAPSTGTGAMPGSGATCSSGVCIF
jgi:hypothetical protein